MKKLSLLFLAIMLSVPAAYAQNNADIMVKQINTEAGNASNTVDKKDLYNTFSEISSISNLQPLSAKAGQVANITIEGDYNSAEIIQQNGTGNYGAINILGNNNTSTLYQSGNSLLSLIYIKGSNNDLDVDQRGNNLGNMIQIDNVNGSDINITQDDVCMRYTQQGGTAGVRLKLTSTQRNVPVIISNN